MVPSPRPEDADDRWTESSNSDFDPLNPEDDEGWEDAEPDEGEAVKVFSLFSDETFPDIRSMIEDCKKRYQFDLVATTKQLSLDFYSIIKLINYIRSEVKAGNLKPDVSSAQLFSSDKYLRPVIEDDALLFCLDEVFIVDPVAVHFNASLQESDGVWDEDKESRTQIAELEQQLKQLQTQFSDYRQAVSKTLDDRWNQPTESSPAGPSKESSREDSDNSYFEAYSYNDIHETMLTDTVRTDAYRDFIYDHKHLFQGKVVLDVGCGTGILSMFCARAGAAKVIAVDNSAIIDKARQNAFANKLDGTITCLRGKIEEVKLPLEKVDIIVSEWMGYGLLFEAMLDSVLWARDRYLKPDGLMAPSHCTLRIAPLADPDYIAEKIHFWDDVYGFDMSAMKEKIYDDAFIRYLPEEALIGSSTMFLKLPLHSTTVDDLTFVKDFEIELNKDIAALDGWAIWFDTFFLPSRAADISADARAELWKESGNDGIAFTTGPAGRETHWRTAVLLIAHDKSSVSPLTKGTKIKGSIGYKKAEQNPRNYDIQIKWADENSIEKGKQTWFLR